MTACSQASYPSRPPVVVDSTEIDSVLFWPPHPRYVALFDTVVAELEGLQRGFSCGQVLACNLAPSFSSDDSTVLRAYAKIEYPGDPSCPLEPQGLDTSFRIAPSPPAVSTLYLKNSIGVQTDSALIVSARVFAESLAYVSADSGAVTTGIFTFHDSTGQLNAAGLPACEVLQGAVFAQSGDTLRVRFHLLLLDSTAPQLSLPPCAGPHNDTVQAVSDRFAFPSP